MSMAMKYRMKQKMTKGGEAECMACKGGECMEHGGMAEDPKGDDGYVSDGIAMLAMGGVIDRIMKKRAGAEGLPLADFESADYDVMDQKAAPDDADYSAANSGDEKGNEALDEDEHDVVSRIMKSRSKKDKNPRPA